MIELMIVVAIVGILAAVALPSYQNYVRRGQLQEAFTQLSAYRVRMEQYYQDAKNYGATGGTACATDTSASSWNGFTSSDARYFSYACVASGTGNQGFTITARGTSGLTTGYTYTIDQAGNKTTTQFKNMAVTAACWLSQASTC